VLLLSGSAGLSQVISILVSPILARLYGPENFGVYTLFTSTVSILVVIATGRFEIALLRPKDDETVSGLTQIGILWLISFIVISLAALGITVNLWSDMSLAHLWYLLPIGILIIGLANLNNYLATRKERFGLIGIGSLIRSIANNGISLFLGYIEVGIGLIIGFISGHLFFNIATQIGLKTSFSNRISLIRGKSLVKEYSEFPLINGTSALANIGSNQLPIIIMAFAFNDATIGMYGLIMRVLNAPLLFIGKAVSQVFFGQTAKEVREGKFDSKQIIQLALKLAILITIILLPLFFFGSEIFSFVFGEEWGDAGQIAGLFVPFYIVRFVYYCLSTIMIVKNELKTELLQNIFALMTQVIAVVLGSFVFDSSLITFQLIAGAGFLIYCVFVYQLIRVIHK
tara:strand:- start:4922 stop:6118 length:1197 start_codon:yes stop_codon:yes gene_type:complete